MIYIYIYIYIHAFLLCFFCDIFDKQNVNDLPESLHFFQANNETKNTEKKDKPDEVFELILKLIL